MATELGSGEFTYEVVDEWARLPEGWSFHEAVDVAVDSHDRVYVFNRGEHPVIVFDREGNFLSSWGKGLFKLPHGVTVGPDDVLYCVDYGDHTVRKCTPGGRVLMTLGTPGEPAPFLSGRPFNMPTKVALDPQTGELYVADGYGNAKVHKFSAEGELLFSWGEPGTDPGEFTLVHSVCTDTEGYVYVADRENHRVQVFDPSGNFITQWHNLHAPCGMVMAGDGEELCYIGEQGPHQWVASSAPWARFPNQGPRISILNLKGERLARLGDVRGGERPDQFLAPHGIAVDSRGDLYMAEVSWAEVGSVLDPPREVRSFRKLVKKA